jgi:hypothetical protein
MWVKWLTLVYFEMVLISASVGAWFAPNVPWEQKSFWPHLMDLLGDVGQMEAHFGLFEHSVNIHVRWLHGLCNRLENQFRRTRWNS